MDLFSRKILTCKFASRARQIHVCYTPRVRVSAAGIRQRNVHSELWHCKISSPCRPTSRCDLASGERAIDCEYYFAIEARAARRACLNCTRNERVVQLALLQAYRRAGKNLYLSLLASKRKYVFFRFYCSGLSRISVPCFCLRLINLLLFLVLSFFFFIISTRSLQGTFVGNSRYCFILALFNRIAYRANGTHVFIRRIGRGEKESRNFQVTTVGYLSFQAPVSLYAIYLQILEPRGRRHVRPFVIKRKGEDRDVSTRGVTHPLGGTGRNIPCFHALTI